MAADVPGNETTALERGHRSGRKVVRTAPHNIDYLLKLCRCSLPTTSWRGPVSQIRNSAAATVSDTSCLAAHSVHAELSVMPYRLLITKHTPERRFSVSARVSKDSRQQDGSDLDRRAPQGRPVLVSSSIPGCGRRGLPRSGAEAVSADRQGNRGAKTSGQRERPQAEVCHRAAPKKRGRDPGKLTRALRHGRASAGAKR